MYCTVKQLKGILGLLKDNYRLTPNYHENIDVLPNDTDELIAVIVIDGDYELPMAHIEVQSGYEHLFE